MLSSKTLKTFVKMHEYKLDAKISGLKAGELEDQITQVHPGVEQGTLHAGGHWDVGLGDSLSRRRPKSRYFNFILTTTR